MIEKYEPEKVWSAVFFDAEQQFYYLKRFRFENMVRHTLFIGETEGSYLVALSGEKRPRFEVVFGGRYESRPAEGSLLMNLLPRNRTRLAESG